MKVIELHYMAHGAKNTAFVFLDDDGMVASEKGLTDLVQSLRRPVGVSADEINAFLTLWKPCPRPEWVPLREAYKAELDAAHSAGCTKCDKAAIARKYVKMINVQTGG